MAVPHYVYLLLKMPSKNGVLTLRGDLLKSYECDKDTIEYASNIRVPSTANEVLAVAKKLSLSKEPPPAKKASQSLVVAPNDIGIKAVQLQDVDSSKTTMIDTELGGK